jgi:hypothetical protein
MVKKSEPTLRFCDVRPKIPLLWFLERPLDFLSITAYPIAKFVNLGDGQYSMTAANRQVHDGLPIPLTDSRRLCPNDFVARNATLRGSRIFNAHRDATASRRRSNTIHPALRLLQRPGRTSGASD